MSRERPQRLKLPGNAVTSAFTALWRGLSDGEGKDSGDPTHADLGDGNEDPCATTRSVESFSTVLSGWIATCVLNPKQLAAMRIASFAPPIRALVAARAAAVDPLLCHLILSNGRPFDEQVLVQRCEQQDFLTYLRGDEADVRTAAAQKEWHEGWQRMVTRTKEYEHKGVVEGPTATDSLQHGSPQSPAAIQVVSLGSGFETRCCSRAFEGHAAWVRRAINTCKRPNVAWSRFAVL